MFENGEEIFVSEGSDNCFCFLVGGGCCGCFVILMVIFVIVLFGGGVVFFQGLKNIDVYIGVVEIVQNDLWVIDEFGELIEIGIFFSGFINMLLNLGDVDFFIFFSGLNGDVMFYVVVIKSVGVWEYELFEIEIECMGVCFDFCGLLLFVLGNVEGVLEVIGLVVVVSEDG